MAIKNEVFPWYEWLFIVGEAAGKTSHLVSGWMIRPDGSVTLNTPFSGFTK